MKNGYPTSFIDKCFKTFLDQLFIKKPQVLTVEKKTLTLVLPFLGNLSLQTYSKCTQKGIRLLQNPNRF